MHLHPSAGRPRLNLAADLRARGLTGQRVHPRGPFAQSAGPGNDDREAGDLITTGHLAGGHLLTKAPNQVHLVDVHRFISCHATSLQDANAANHLLMHLVDQISHPSALWVLLVAIFRELDAIHDVALLLSVRDTIKI